MITPPTLGPVWNYSVSSVPVGLRILAGTSSLFRRLWRQFVHVLLTLGPVWSCSVSLVLVGLRLLTAVVSASGLHKMFCGK